MTHDRPDILYLVHRFPFPPDKGDRIRAFHILRFLSKRARVHVACLADEPVSQQSIDELGKYCVRLAVVPVGRWSRWLRALGSFMIGRTISEGAFRSSALRDVLRTWTGLTRIHAVLASASSMVPYLRRKELQDIPAVVDLVDVDSQKWLDYAAAKRFPKSWLYRTEGRRLRRIEKELPTWARAVTLVSEAEKNIYEQFCQPGEVHSVTNGVDLDYFQPAEVETQETCVFVGAMDYYPNVDAVCWFGKEVWPAIRQARPTARFQIVGRHPTQAVKSLAAIPGIEVLGGVADVRMPQARASVVVAPLRIARGLQNKVLEALAMAKAVVASPPALAALQARPGEHLLSATTPAEWVDTVLTAMASPHRREELGRAGRDFVERHHNWDTCLRPLDRLLSLRPATKIHLVLPMEPCRC